MKKFFYTFIILAPLVLVNIICLAGKKEKQSELKIIAEYKLKVTEPSGLALTSDRKFLWTVSDQTSTAYMISLDGKIVNNIKINAPDLEGIAVVNDTTIAVVSEVTGEIIFMSYSGKEVKRVKTEFSNKDNNGLEGIAYNKSSKHVFVLKEKNPGLLIEYNNKLKQIRQTELKFADDYSSLDFTNETKEFWLTSDESKSIIRCSFDGKMKESYKMKITQMEGIAIDLKTKKIYVVSDAEEKLYVIELK
ncbi:MAG: SdiA-regulated domain-containing protein [Ignavibacteriales bacterium]|nr:SdiA-regulated domain-containing protein [Ignavibacteriales bacterium]